MRANGNQLGRNTHVFLTIDHFADNGFVVPCLLAAGFAALKQPVIALRVNQPLFVEARLLEAVVDVRGDRKVVLALHQLEQVFIHRLRRVHITVDENIPAPVRPEFLFRRIREKAAGIHIRKAVFGGKIGEILSKSRTGIGKSRRRGQHRARADDDGISVMQSLLQPVSLRGAGGYRWIYRFP